MKRRLNASASRHGLKHFFCYWSIFSLSKDSILTPDSTHFWDKTDVLWIQAYMLTSPGQGCLYRIPDLKDILTFSQTTNLRLFQAKGV